MCDFNRFEIVEAYYWYSTLWGPIDSGIQARLNRIPFSPGICSRLETADYGTKVRYGRIVMERESAWVAFLRASKRRPELFGSWPGANNVKGWSMWDKVSNWIQARMGVSQDQAYALMNSYVGGANV